MIEQLTNDWQQLVGTEFEKPYFQALQQFLQKEYDTAVIYPKREHIFTALQTTAYSDVKVVLLGQDPYHGANQAHGLSFSVQAGEKLPPSLRNMLKELQDDLGYDIPMNGDLTKWAQQGVLLLNTVLTVREGEANSHKGQGWEQFTDVIIEKIAKREQPIVFLLWGKQAQLKRAIIEQYGQHHIIFDAPHPSPLSAHRGFFGSKPYSHVNEALTKLNLAPIGWRLSSQQTKLFD